jgi:shikimate dehydrogenase
MITGRTRVFTILAHPSSNVMAPIIYNHIFRSMGLDMVYIAQDVLPEAVPAVVKSFSGWSNLGGFNVTVPYKETVATLVNSLCEVSSRIGVVNTVVRNEDGRLSGYNTDGFGAVKARPGSRGYMPDDRRRRRSTLHSGCLAAFRSEKGAHNEPFTRGDATPVQSL